MKDNLFKNSRENQIMTALIAAYPDAECELKFGSVFQLLVAVMLSAQCTDKRVNLVTEKLFEIAPQPKDFDRMPQQDLERHIFSCGFYHSKAKNIKATAKDIMTRFDGKVPDSLEQLVLLKGVGRKTANVVLNVAFNQETIAVDTHVFRVSRRLGFSAGDSPKAVEMDLTRLFKSAAADGGFALGKVHHALIFHGRYCCKSQKPSCATCPVKEYCNWEY